MKYLALIALALISGCGQQPSQPTAQQPTGHPNGARFIGPVGDRANAFTFFTPEGAYCVSVQSTYGRDSSVTCRFPAVLKGEQR